MPAHDEALIIAGTLRTILPQLGDTDRLVVVADNCTDETAGIAATEGAEVVIRQDLTHRGKGYALDFGVRHLESDAPDIVLIVDADCRVAPGAIDRLARLCARTERPVQALYLMHAGKDTGLKMRIAEFAWVVKNQVRPSGLHRLGLPCQLMGTGMAFPWACISTARLATGHIVEDLKLGVDLARAGTAPLFCPEALVTSDFPASSAGVRSQRTRWEHGHLSVIFSEAPRLFLNSLVALNVNSMALALDLSVPPLALLTLLVLVVWLAAVFLFVFTKSPFALAVTTATAVLLLLSVLLSWRGYGRPIISLGNLAFAMIHAFLKIPLYLRFVVARQVKWVRSKREADRR
jgi:cellulose synthase/poly-beta-1,6-N-acetylglucosamine synthase-like glycosyltransferase